MKAPSYFNSIGKSYRYKAILINILTLLLCLFAGCSLQPVNWVSVKGENLTGRAGIPLLDPNDPNEPFVVKKKIENGDFKNITMKARIELDNTCRIKYHWPYHLISGKMVAEGWLGSNGKKYPVVLDTGCPVTCIVTDKHVIKNKLPIYHLGNNPTYSADMGLCKIPELRIGKMTMFDLPCLYIEKRDAIQIFGVTIAYDESMLIGLQILQAFKYVMFDNINKEVEFSPREIFEPAHPQLWKSYPFVIKEKSNDNDAIFVTMTVAGQEVELYLDTGSRQGLQFSEQTWEKLREKIPITKLRNGNFRTAFLENIACKKGTVKELDIGGIKIKNIEIVVLPDDNPAKLQTLLGMQCFRDTIIVLDFGRNLLWVKTSGTN
jgi:hypothetical protein